MNSPIEVVPEPKQMSETSAFATTERHPNSMNPSNSTPPQPTVSQTIEYIESFAAELKFMAQQAGLARLGLILLLAEQEAGRQLEVQRLG